MPLTLADTLGFPGVPSTDSSVQATGLFPTASLWGDHHFPSHAFPVRLPVAWVLAWKDLGLVRKGVMVEEWLACFISSLVSSEGGRRGPGQV